MKTKSDAHTPGPWSIADTVSDYRISGPDGIGVARTDGISPRRNNCEENAANARLIAAAPDLLEAAKEFEGAGDYNDNTVAWHKLRAAIDKAENGGK